MTADAMREEDWRDLSGVGGLNTLRRRPRTTGGNGQAYDEKRFTATAARRRHNYADVSTSVVHVHRPWRFTRTRFTE